MRTSRTAARAPIALRSPSSAPRSITSTPVRSISASTSGTPSTASGGVTTRSSRLRFLARVRARKLPQAQDWNGAVGAKRLAWFNGHHLAGGFAQAEGLPCVTFRGMVETPDRNAFATARFLSDRVILTGHGRESSRELTFRV